MKIGLTEEAKVLWAKQQPALLASYEEYGYLLLISTEPRVTDYGVRLEVCLTTFENYGSVGRYVWLGPFDLVDRKRSRTFLFINFDMPSY